MSNTKLFWTDNIVPDKAGLWAFMSPQNDTVFYQPVSDIGAQHPERWERGRWCLTGPVPIIDLPPIVSGPAGKCDYDTDNDGNCDRCYKRGGCLNIGGPFSSKESP